MNKKMIVACAAFLMVISVAPSMKLFGMKQTVKNNPLLRSACCNQIIHEKCLEKCFQGRSKKRCPFCRQELEFTFAPVKEDERDSRGLLKKKFTRFLKDEEKEECFICADDDEGEEDADFSGRGFYNVNW